MPNQVVPSVLRCYEGKCSVDWRLGGAPLAGSTRARQPLEPLTDKGIIHLVDDDPAVRSSLARLLGLGGYRVREYASGAELIEAADTLVEGCILLDINMPEVDGFAVTKALTERGVDLPVVMMTGSGDLTLLAWKAGVAAFVPKPFGRSEIISVLDEITEGHFVATAP